MSDQAKPLPARRQAQQRADEILAFQAELARLEAAEVLVLDETQRQSLADYHQALLATYASAYDIDRDHRASQISLGMRVASFLGALALAASAFFLFYQFWGRFSEAAQVAILIISALGSLGLTVWVQGRDASGYFTKLAALVAFACFVLNISMIGQIFNITPSDKALLPWAAMAFLLAYACDLRLLLAAGIVCVIAFVAARIGTWNGVYWLHAGERPENFFVAATLLIALPQLLLHRHHPGFAAIYRVFGLLTVFIPMLILSHWGQISYLDLEPKLIEGGYQVAGFAGSALAIWIGTRREWPESVNTGIVFFVLFLYTKFYNWWWDVMPKYLFFLVLGLTALLVLLILKRLRGVIGRSDTGERA
ncbi:DUF2157 domain-containing protein [Accumulibacter sp.]|uniref:DUF2157 domain-containing protein n=1 Tax=Accumulibacter sp. TaxID=2053492 RepID=UPI001A396937|nr:DUF2157 domain-containing protein [Accumulibacter sp.]MBL8375263.1 DUF2157 domain-containing protein [Accumulibacter sp.]